MAVYQFSIPGHSTRREFAVYVVVARRRTNSDFKLYVGKTGDNRAGCNPVISRAGNHFSYNEIHSQVRNKLDAPPHDFDYEYFYVTFDVYHVGDESRRDKIDAVNEMERVVNQALQRSLEPSSAGRLLNPHKGTGGIQRSARDRRSALMTPERRVKVEALANAVVDYIGSFCPAALVGSVKVLSQPNQ